MAKPFDSKLSLEVDRNIQDSESPDPLVRAFAWLRWVLWLRWRVP